MSNTEKKEEKKIPKITKIKNVYTDSDLNKITAAYIVGIIVLTVVGVKCSKQSFKNGINAGYIKGYKTAVKDLMTVNFAVREIN